MNIVYPAKEELPLLAPLCAAFRAALRAFKGGDETPDIEAAAGELSWHAEEGRPVYAVEEGGRFIGYAILRIDDGIVWLEQIFVEEASRRKGAATLLFEEAERVAAGYGEPTVYNYVHPNNLGMISFLRSRGYNVLNLIEIRKPYPGEALSAVIRVGESEFDY